MYWYKKQSHDEFSQTSMMSVSSGSRIRLDSHSGSQILPSTQRSENKVTFPQHDEIVENKANKRYERIHHRKGEDILLMKETNSSNF